MNSNVNFCPLPWHFCSESNTNKIEKIQERALRFIYEDHHSTYEDRHSTYEDHHSTYEDHHSTYEDHHSTYEDHHSTYEDHHSTYENHHSTYEDHHSTFGDLLVKSILSSLKIKRWRTMAIEVHRIINKESLLYLHDLIKIKRTNYSFRYQILAVKTTRYGLRSFRFFVSKLWNELPNHFQLQTSFNQFKYFINSWNGSTCHCNVYAWTWLFYMYIVFI